jgi:glycosyltransferase involved in cell wall biosynthesis
MLQPVAVPNKHLNDYANATKVMHNALQGHPQDLSEEQWMTWQDYDAINAREMAEGWDVSIVHDPQPAALSSLVPEKSRRWVWRCHIDLSTPNPDTVSRLIPYLDPYPAAVFHMRKYVPADMDGRAYEIPAAIDPLAPKNLNNVGAIEVNAFQSHCDVVIQKSTREGFGLAVTEAIWKGRPSVGGGVGEIPAQVPNGETGFLVSDVDECAQRSLAILRDPELGKRLGLAGKETVRRRFLMPRLSRDWLELFEQLEV